MIEQSSVVCDNDPGFIFQESEKAVFDNMICDVSIKSGEDVIKQVN